MIAAVRQKYTRIPKPIRIFLVRAVIVFILWQLLYHLFLQPIRVPDSFLTDITTMATVKVLSLFYSDVSSVLGHFKAIITIGGRRIIGIADPCNALELYVLYISFLFCYPNTTKKRFIFLLIGLPAIFVLNIIRCVTITWLNISHKGWVDISHHYIFTAIMYLLIFYSWVLYTKGGREHAA